MVSKSPYMAMQMDIENCNLLVI